MFRRLSVFILIVAILITSFSPTMASNSLTAVSNQVSISVNGFLVNLSPAPVLKNGRVLVPIRGVFESLGAKVDWNEQTRQVIVTTADTTMLLEIDASSVLIDGIITPLDVPATLISSRTYVPIRIVAEYLGHKVDWDPNLRRVLITTQTQSAQLNNTSLPIIGSKFAMDELLRYSSVLNNYIFGASTFGNRDDIAFTESLAPAAPSADKASGDYSQTNVQTLGVDESDIVKTDGKHIYAIVNNRVLVMDANPNAPKILSEITWQTDEAQATDLYIYQNKLVVIGSKWDYWIKPLPMESPDSQSISRPMIWPGYNQSKTIVRVYDLTTPTTPNLVEDLSFDGTIASSRLIKNNLFVVINKSIDYWQSDLETRPSYTNHLTGATHTPEYDAIRYFPDHVMPNFLITVGLNLSTSSVDFKAYLGQAQTLYASNDNLYIAMTHYDYKLGTLPYRPLYEENSILYKFEMKNSQVNYTTRAKIPGRILNQYAMDEFNGHLRVATTTGNTWDEVNLSKNHIYILDQSLLKVGYLENLAPGERIYSTRFAGNRIYMVTFKDIDPFFVIDATNPKEPKVLGELKIPGFSTYMHILGENHILGFGSDVIDQNGFATPGGLKLSLFDVTDPQKPIESKMEIIGKQGTYSEIQYNPKALMIDIEKGLMAFPISVASKTPYVTDFVGAYIYSISNESFEFKGLLSHQLSNDKNWGSQIQRTLYIGDYMYSISFEQLQVHLIDSLSKVSQLPF